MGTINVAELNFPWEKTASQFFGMMYDFTIAITKFTSQYVTFEAII